MSQVYRDHVTATVLDFGVIGEQQVEVVYDWHEPNPSNDPLQVPENGGAVIKDVVLFVDGKEVSVFHWLTPTRTQEICDIVREQWQ